MYRYAVMWLFSVVGCDGSPLIAPTTTWPSHAVSGIAGEAGSVHVTWPSCGVVCMIYVTGVGYYPDFEDIDGGSVSDSLFAVTPVT